MKCMHISRDGDHSEGLGWSNAVWNLSENSSNLVAWPVPKWALNSWISRAFGNFFLKYHSLWAWCILIRPGQPNQPAPPGCPFNRGPLSASGSWACHQSFNPSFYQFSKGSIATWSSSIWVWWRYDPSQAHACGENPLRKTGMSLNLT